MDEMCEIVGHDWDECLCIRCAEERHQFAGCRCILCGDEIHHWQGCTCTRCGVVARAGHEAREDACLCRWCGTPTHTVKVLTCIRCGYECTYQETVDSLADLLRRLARSVTAQAMGLTLLRPGRLALCEECSAEEELRAFIREIVTKEARKSPQWLRAIIKILQELDRRDRKSQDPDEVVLDRRLTLYRDVTEAFERDFEWLWNFDTERREKDEEAEALKRSLSREVFAHAGEAPISPGEICDRMVGMIIPYVIKRVERSR